MKKLIRWFKNIFNFKKKEADYNFTIDKYYINTNNKIKKAQGNAFISGDRDIPLDNDKDKKKFLFEFIENPYFIINYKSLNYLYMFIDYLDSNYFLDVNVEEIIIHNDESTLCFDIDYQEFKDKNKFESTTIEGDIQVYKAIKFYSLSYNTKKNKIKLFIKHTYFVGTKEELENNIKMQKFNVKDMTKIIKKMRTDGVRKKPKS